jgi:Kef-type K+ transport system membrane component KefB
MQGLDTFSLIIAASGVIILSYFFNILSKKTNIPSVLMLIALGVIAKVITGWDGTKFMGILEVLGNVGLIMIVLEAALDLQLKKEKWPIIWKSFAVALLGLIGSTFFIAMVLSFFLELDTKISVIYAVPLGIMSSAIIIPSVAGLLEEKKEFMIYESTFSDILGIMLFYFILGNHDNTNTQSIVFDVTSNIAVTIILSIVLSYALVFVFQKIKTQVKLFLLISILTLLYAVGKKFHLSSLVIVLIFGLVLNNHHLFFRGFLKKYIDVPSVTEILHNFHLITAESAFVVRTFFFVIFGISISLVSLLSVEFAVISAFIVLGIYIVRFGILKVFKPKSFSPEVYIAPRGLITILLFYAIPEELRSERFDESILLFTILATSLLMTFALIRNAKSESDASDEELLTSDGSEGTLTENHTNEI